MFTKKRLFVFVVVAALTVAALWFARVPLASGQDAQPVKVEFAAYEGNPVVLKGAAGEWDSDIVWEAVVLRHENVFHMFYIGNGVSVGYATSEDGLSWTEYADNPILGPDPELSPGGFTKVVPLVDGDTWVLYFSDQFFGGQNVWRATAPAPTGPWTIDSQPVLEPSGAEDWDYTIYPSSLVHTETEYVLYYAGRRAGSDWFEWIGRATSPDGITWTKYDDPATTEAAYAHSDPVFLRGEAGSWDDMGVFNAAVLLGDHGWEMFYTGTQEGMQASAGYATSQDGITWTRFVIDPVPNPADVSGYGASSVVFVDGTYYLYHAFEAPTGIQIGVSTGTVTWE
jgi:hypothetical protein